MKHALFAILALLLFPVSGCDCLIPGLPTQIDVIRAPLPTGRVVIYGDSRPAVTGEQYFMGRTDPARERALIIARIAAEKPDLIVHSGDLVARGSSDDHWDLFDRTHRPIFDARIPFYPALGNHEYTSDTQEALGYFRKRFPFLGKCRWYAVKAGPLCFVMLDSNFDELQPKFVDAQGRWFQKTLEAAMDDAGVKAVIVVSHHPPYTNSNVHGPSDEVRRRFADPAASCPKFKMYVAGHVHNYERFSINGAHFVVSGGGGAPSTSVRTSGFRTKPEFDGPEIRPFHYLLLTTAPDRATVDTMMLQPDGSWKSGDRFEITW